jgi:hypothetical protein
MNANCKAFRFRRGYEDKKWWFLDNLPCCFLMTRTDLDGHAWPVEFGRWSSIAAKAAKSRFLPNVLVVLIYDASRY